MQCVEELSPEALFDLDEIEALPVFDAPDFVPDVPAFTFTEAGTSSATACTYSVTVANENPYDGVLCYAQSPVGLFSLYDDMADTAASGWSRGGVSGSVQGNFYSGVTALLDTIGGQGVQSTAANSGAAAGRGDYRGAVVWGGATVGLVAMNASTFAFPKGAVVNSGQYLKNPILYDIGSGVLPKSVFRDIAHLSPVERGAYLLDNYSAWERALLPLRASPLDYLAVLGQGPTTGGLLGALGLNLYLNQNANQDGNCK